MTIDYKITFYNNWHCGSGLSAGADIDLLVIKDKNRLPFVPGKTIKGLVKEAMTDILDFTGKGDAPINKLFGMPNAKETDEGKDSNEGDLFFTNANLSQEIANEIIASKTADYLYLSVSSTAIAENGVADNHTLRKMEVTIPCDLYGQILNVPNEYVELLTKSLKFVKRLGQNRNRGLGRCDINVIDTTD